MSSDEDIEAASRRLKQALLRKAFSEGRGPAVIADLNRRHRQKQAMLATPDEDIVSQFEAAAYALNQDREENRRAILECLSKTNFNREESQEIRELMMQDLAEQELTIDLLRAEGVTEDKLPKLSMALARLNAYERLNGKSTGEVPDQWSDNDPQVQASRQKARMILSQDGPAHTLN
jgi:uncharacterized protein YfaS (alpha-2-macroglobulin family)